MSMIAEAWLVIAADGFRAVFLDRAVAERYAASAHGTVHPLIRADVAAGSAP